MRRLRTRRRVGRKLEYRIICRDPKEVLRIRRCVYKQPRPITQPLLQIVVEHVRVLQHRIPCRLRGSRKPHGDQRVVLEACANIGAINECVDAYGFEQRFAADARELEELRRAYDACCDENLFGSGHRLTGAYSGYERVRICVLTRELPFELWANSTMRIDGCPPEWPALSSRVTCVLIRMSRLERLLAGSRYADAAWLRRPSPTLDCIHAASKRMTPCETFR